MWQIGDRDAWEAGTRDADLEAAFGTSASLPPQSVSPPDASGSGGSWASSNDTTGSSAAPSMLQPSAPSAPLPLLSVPQTAMRAPLLNETALLGRAAAQNYDQQRMQNIAGEKPPKLAGAGPRGDKLPSRPRCVAPSSLIQEQRDDADYVPARRADRVDQVQRPRSSRLTRQVAATLRPTARPKGRASVRSKIFMKGWVRWR